MTQSTSNFASKLFRTAMATSFVLAAMMTTNAHAQSPDCKHGSGAYKKQRPASGKISFSARTLKATHFPVKTQREKAFQQNQRCLQFPVQQPTTKRPLPNTSPTGLQSRSTVLSELTKFSMSGEAVLEIHGNGLSDAPTGYLMKSDLGMQSGSSIMVSDPVIDDSNRRTTVWSFRATQGPNPHFGNEPLHVIQTDEGLIFCEWKANCRIQIDNASGEVTQIWNGSFQVVGGTGIYRQADGNWDFAMMTEPSQNELSPIALFEFNGSANFAQLATDLQYDARR